MRVSLDTQRLASLVLAVLLVASLAAVPLAGVAVAQDNSTGTSNSTDSGGDEVVDVGSGADNGTEDSGPTMAEGLRLNPVAFDKEYARIETVKPGEQYNITGNLAVWSSNIDVDTARVAQPNAEARVLDGSRTIEVSFSDDAAPTGSSYYELELFFEDDSQAVIELYVSKTDLMVASVEHKEAYALVERIQRDAENADAGYNVEERGVAAAEDYYEDQKKTAAIISNILGPTIEKFQFALIAAGTSALFIILLCALLWFFLKRIKKGHGQKLEALVNTPNLQDLKRKAMTLARYEDRQEAAEHPLHEVPEIGRDHVYWIDTMDVHTVKQLADRFHFGQVRFDDGEIVRDDDGNPVMEDHGVEDLQDADRIRDTWLEPVIRDGMLTEQDAIAHGKKALDLMASKYNEPGYRSSRVATRELLDDLSEGRTYSFGAGNTGTGGVSGSPAAAGGDD